MTSLLWKEDYQLNKVILYPSGSVTAREHYSNTIETPVDIDKIVQFIPQNNIINFMDLYTTGAVPIWGVTPGKKNVNKNKNLKSEINLLESQANRCKNISAISSVVPEFR